MQFDHNPIDLSNGSIVRVTRIDTETERIYYDRRDGGTGWYRHPDAMDVVCGQVLYLPEDLEDRPPDRLGADFWPTQGNDIATIKQISDDGQTVVAEINNRYVLVSQRRETPFKEGQTVAVDPMGVLGAVLSSIPIDRLGLRANDIDPADLIVHPDLYNVNLADFGGASSLVERAKDLVTVALDPHGRLQKIGANPVKGILFSGPSGTGKTHLARALSHHAGSTFYLIDGPEIINKWVGESEQRLRDLFVHAQQNAPAILFFDELDSIVSARGSDAPEYASRFVGQFLIELDGFESSQGVLVIAATNLPGMLDSALLRPGRLSFKLEFDGQPNKADRIAILRASGRHVRGSERADWHALADETEGWTPAELAMIWTEAGIFAALDERSELCAEDVMAGMGRASENRLISKRQGQSA